jgi:hypothetical protein
MKLFYYCGEMRPSAEHVTIRSFHYVYLETNLLTSIRVSVFFIGMYLYVIYQ